VARPSPRGARSYRIPGSFITCLCASLPQPLPTLSPYTTLFRSLLLDRASGLDDRGDRLPRLLLSLPRHEFGSPLSAGRALEFMRSEEHTSELQSRSHLVCRLLLE